MIIILEGPDGSGKSTLANMLAIQNNYKIIHRSAPKSEEEKQAMMHMYIDTIANTENAILDRCWYSELVYGPIMRDKSVMTLDQMYYLERMLVKRGGIIIYCVGDLDVLWERCQKRGEDHILSVGQLDEIVFSYEKLMAEKHLIPVLKYEYKDL